MHMNELHSGMIGVEALHVTVYVINVMLNLEEHFQDLRDLVEKN